MQGAGIDRPIERCIGPGLLAHVLVAKFADHLPAVSPGGDPCTTALIWTALLSNDLERWLRAAFKKLSRKFDTAPATM